jgi:hypothetical protein
MNYISATHYIKWQQKSKGGFCGAEQYALANR